MNRRHAIAGLVALPLGTVLNRGAYAMSDFTKSVVASLPPGMTLPEPLITAMDWLEKNGHVRSKFGDALLTPADEPPASEVGFRPMMHSHNGSWLGSDISAINRLAPIIQAAGDGSFAALWRREEDDQISFVYLGSGSGSTMMCVLTDDPVDMLRLMAIGYAELSDSTLDKTPEEEHAEAVRSSGPELVGPFRPPVEFQAFVRDTFGVTIPRRASEIVKRVAFMDDAHSEDPFWKWVQNKQRT